MPTANPPWERQPKEPPAAWHAFTVYRDLGLTRSIGKASADLNLHPSTLSTYSARWAWVSRVAAWDNEQDRLEQLWLQEERRKAVTRHVRQAQSLQSVWLRRLTTMNVDQLSPSEVIRFAEVATKMERDSLLLTQVNVNVTGAVGVIDLGDLSPAEVAQRLELLQSEVRTRLADAAIASEPESA